MEEDIEKNIENYSLVELQEAIVNLDEKYKKFTDKLDRKNVRKNMLELYKIYNHKVGFDAFNIK